MTEHEDEVARLLAPLREPLPSEPLSASGRPANEASAEAMRERVLRVLRAQVMELPEAQLRRERAHKQRRVWLVAGTGGLALAAAAMLAFVDRSAPEPTASVAPNVARSADEGSVIEGAQWVSADGQSHPIVQGMLVPEGSRELRAERKTARVRTRVGAEVQLAPNTRLSVQEDAALRVLDGEVACSVPKLGSEIFSIDTPSARVVVHGTRFTVRVAGDKRERTCVRVQEGVVAVHAHRPGAQPVRLLAGDTWGCEQAPIEAAAIKPVPPRKPSQARHETRVTSRGTLDAENRLLAEALSAERENDRVRANALFRQLLERHPSSPLASEARAGLGRTR
jgi:ferric-dicitrate binding protein FerR (iron transport regulator)